MYIYILNKYTLGNLSSPKHVFEFKKHPPVMGHMEGGGWGLWGDAPHKYLRISTIILVFLAMNILKL